MTKHTIKIEFTAGSPFQEESMLAQIKTMLYAWQIFYFSNHKKNKIDITLDGEDLNEKALKAIDNHR